MNKPCGLRETGVICFVSETLGNGLSSSLHSCFFFISLHFKESGV